MAPVFSDLRSQFPITVRYAYLDHAAIAPLATPVRAAMERYLRRQAEEPFDADYWDNLREGVRNSLGRLLRAAPRCIALTRSTTHGLGLVAGGMDWREGDNLVSVQGEFPANIYPWMALRARGVELRLHRSADGRIDPDALMRLCDARTRLVTLSWVQFWNGYRSDLHRIGALLRSSGRFLVVDAMQAAGALETDLEALPVDVFCAGAPKWMLGPIGIGFAYIGERIRDHLRPVNVGAASVLHDHEYFAYDLTLKPDSRRFEESAYNIPAIVGLGAAIDLFLSAGPAKVEAAILRLVGRLHDGLVSRGYVPLFEPASPVETAGIVSFRHRELSPRVVHDRLRAAGVIVSLRGDFVRASPHCYNTDDDIDRLLEALPA